MIYKVGFTYEINGRRRKFTYKDIPHSIIDWVEADKYLPADFDLVFLQLFDEKIIYGWHSGHHWDALRLKQDDRIKSWRMEKE